MSDGRFCFASERPRSCTLRPNVRRHNLYDHVYHQYVVEGLPAWLRFVLGSAVVLYGGGGLVLSVAKFRRMTVPQERQRCRCSWQVRRLAWRRSFRFLAAIFWGILTQSAGSLVFYL